jgi:hypothetical protein
MIAVIDPEQVHAAVTVALDAAMESMVDEITRRVMAALTSRRPSDRIESRPAVPAPPAPPAPAPPLPANPETARPVTRASGIMGPVTRQSVRVRPSSILGLDLPPSAPHDPENPGGGDNS